MLDFFMSYGKQFTFIVDVGLEQKVSTSNRSGLLPALKNILNLHPALNIVHYV